VKKAAENNLKMLGALQIVEANCMGTVTSLWVISHTLPLVLLLPITNLNLISSQKFIVNSKYYWTTLSQT
jgi:hypothetical protein